MKPHSEGLKPKTKNRSCGAIPAKKIQIIPAGPDEHARFDALCGDLHYLGAAKPIGHFLRQAAVFEGE